MEFVGLYAFGVLVLATLAFAAVRRPKSMPGELFRIHETPMTGMLGLALWVEAGIVLYLLATRPGQIAASQGAKLNAYIFLVASVAFGCGMILYSFVKTVIVRSDDIVYVSFLGQPSTLRWDEIDEVKATQGKRLTLIGKNGDRFTVGGEKAPFREFIKMACAKVNPEAGEDILKGLKRAYKL